MATHRIQILTTKSPEEVFDYVVDFSNTADWDPGVISSTQLNGGEVKAGTAFDLVLAVGKKEVPITYAITVYDRPHKATLVGETEAFRSVDTITVRNSPAGVLVDYQVTVQLSGLLSLFDPIFRFQLARIAEKAADGLREKIT